MIFISPQSHLKEPPRMSILKIVCYRKMSVKGVCAPLFGGLGGVSLDQDCMSYMREENELVLVCYFFLLVLEILVHCVKFEGVIALQL